MKNKLLLLLLVSTVSCTKLLEPTPQGIAEVSAYYSNYNGLLGGINGCYNSLGGVYSRNGEGGDFFWTDILSDDATPLPAFNPEVATFEAIDVAPNSSTVQKLWTNHYSGINRCNVLINRASAVSLRGDQKVLADQFVGEARFLRAFYYFNLIRLFGDVPLNLTEEGDLTKLAISRSTTDEIYAQIEKDLTEAIAALPVRHPNPNLTTNPPNGITGGFEVGRATSGSAKALLAIVYLTRQRWAEAAATATELVNSGLYSLMPNYADNFAARGGAENNAESVFEVQYTVGAGTNEDFGLRTDSQQNGGNGFLRPTDNADPLNPANFSGAIRQAFTAGDDRNPTVFRVLAAPQPLLLNKYSTPLPSRNNSNTNLPLIRFAEVLLIQAEALNETGKSADALAALNRVRIRAKLTPLATTLSQTETRQAIRQERRLELCFENKRWFDLNRWGITVQTMTTQGRPMQAYETILPIPQTELDRNPSLKQNPGYN